MNLLLIILLMQLQCLNNLLRVKICTQEACWAGRLLFTKIQFSAGVVIFYDCVLFYVWPHGGAHAQYNSHLYFLFLPQGEICLCTSRIFVERSIYPEFLAKFVEAARQWKTGAPSDPSNHNGALVSKEHLKKVRQSHDQTVILNLNSNHSLFSDANPFTVLNVNELFYVHSFISSKCVLPW